MFCFSKELCCINADMYTIVTLHCPRVKVRVRIPIRVSLCESVGCVLLSVHCLVQTILGLDILFDLVFPPVCPSVCPLTLY